jgi:hypothetical protein
MKDKKECHPFQRDDIRIEIFLNFSLASLQQF